MVSLILFTDDFQLAHGLIQRVIHSASVIKVELEENYLISIYSQMLLPRQQEFTDSFWITIL